MPDQQNNRAVIEALLSALNNSRERELENQVARWRLKCANGNIIMLPCYKRRLYNALLQLRHYRLHIKSK